MKAAIRISGLVGVDKRKASTLESLNLRRKYNCILLSTEDQMNRLEHVKELVSFGEISGETEKLLMEKRGEKKNVDGKKTALKPFFRLHPPRGGFKKSTKLPYPKGVLGENKDFDNLIKRML